MCVIVVFSRNNLASISHSIANLMQLTTLDLQCVSPSSSLPCRRSTRYVRHVRIVVVFSNNLLTSLPDWFGNLVQLTELSLECVTLSSSLSRRCAMRVVCVAFTSSLCPAGIS